MPRTARVVIPEFALHVVQRGHDRHDCFFNESDYVAYLTYLARFAARFGCAIHAYCLMTNHVHLLMTPRTAEACALVMRYTGQYYVQRVNRRLGRTGTLWEGRFHSCLVIAERYALTCYRYIELNPVEARMVGKPHEYPWSSFAANAGVVAPHFLIPHAAYTALATDEAARARAYCALFDLPLDPQLVNDIRKATRGGYTVGSERKRPGRPSGTGKEGPSLF